jgi:hypothetical protein
MKYQYGPDGPEPPQEDFWDGWLVTWVVVAAILVLGGLIWLGTRSKELVGVMRIVVGVVALMLSIGRWIFRGTGGVGSGSLRPSIRRFRLIGAYVIGFRESRPLTRNGWLSLLLVTLGVLGFIFLSILQKAWSSARAALGVGQRGARRLGSVSRDSVTQGLSSGAQGNHLAPCSARL